MLRRWARRKLQGVKIFEIINAAMVTGAKSWSQSFKIVLLTRASPLFPFPLINHAHGITQVPFPP